MEDAISSAAGASCLLSRRAALAIPPGLAATVTTRGERTPRPAAWKMKPLVAYFSRSGNTRVIAGTLQRALDADIFEITPAHAYPADYEETVEQARQERDRGVEPPLAARVERMGGYDALYLGFPIWGETAPPVIRSFLRAHDLEGKVIRPLITHGGYGAGNSLAVLTSHAPGPTLASPFVLEADQERRTINQVKAWLESRQPVSPSNAA